MNSDLFFSFFSVGVICVVFSANVNMLKRVQIMK